MQTTYIFRFLAIIEMCPKRTLLGAMAASYRRRIHRYDDLTQRGEVWGLSFSPLDERPLFFLSSIMFNEPLP